MAEPFLDEDAALPDALRHARFVHSDIYEAPVWYDVDYAGYRGEEAFYRIVLIGAVRAGGVVVELGVGTGRLALRFAADGFVIHGVEPSAPMRARLAAKRASSPAGSLVVEDATAATFAGPSGRIDVVTFPFNGLLHVRTRDEMLASFSHVREKLDDDGRFALDLTGPYWQAMLYGPMPWGRTDERIHPDTGKRVLTCDRSRFDEVTRAIRIDIRYLVVGEDEGVEVVLEQTMWTWQQVLSALSESGFAVDLLFGDVNMAPFDEGSSRLLVSAKKR